jgi:aminoglycoside phosphotransferase (APT) family kinase protein
MTGSPDPAIVTWLAEVTGTESLDLARRTGGASRAGYAVDAHLADGTTRELWLREDPGFGPQSHTLYSLPREAAVYRALAATPMRVAGFVAVHPDLPAFLMERVRGESRFSRVTDPAAQRSIGTQLVEQLALLHDLDPAELGLDELGPVAPLPELVTAEIDEWERQYEAAGGGVPVISLALAWLRDHVPTDDGRAVSLVQGDTGPGNFMFDGDELTAVTDWELAHWGDRHDDLAWVLVRDTLDPLPELEERLADYERASGRPIQPARLRYFRVLAQCRATIGTLAGARSRDARGEIAWQLIYNTLHTRLLAEALADADGVTTPPPLDPGDDDGEHSWVFDVALADLRDVVVPAVADDFASTRAKNVARLLKYLREVERLGPAYADAERAELASLLGRAVDAADVDTARAALCAAIARGAVDRRAALAHCLARAARDTAVMRPAMGSLADRHLTAVRQLQGGDAIP